MSNKTTKSPKVSLSETGVSKVKGTPVKGLPDLEAVDLNTKPNDLSPAMTKKVNALKNVQLNLVEIEARFYEELHELECKFAKLYEPHFEKRRNIISGSYEPTEEDGKWALDDDASSGEKSEAKKAIEAPEASELHESGKELLANLKAQFKNGNEDEKGIPHFWLETLKSFRITSEIIEDYDEPILEYLQDIKVVLSEKKPYGYVLEFHFAENPYFTNKVLTKTYELKTEFDSKDPFSYEGPDLDKTIGCKIDWKQGKNVTVKVTKKKIKPKNKKAPPKIITKEEKQPSFFSFFDSPNPTAGDNNKQVALRSPKRSTGGSDDESDNDEDVKGDILAMADFEIGQYLREKIVPKATLYYLGEYDDFEDEYEDYDEEDGEDDEDGEEDDEDEEDEDEDDGDDDEGDHKKHTQNPKLKAVKGGPKAGPGASGKSGEPTPTECKQS